MSKIHELREIVSKEIYVLAKDSKLDYIETPSIFLNSTLNGGFGKGRIHLINGKESSGKTTLLLQTVAFNQRKDPNFNSLFIDAEHAFDTEYAESLGVDLDRMDVVRTVDIEDIYELIYAACFDIEKYSKKDRLKNKFKNNYDMILVDSIDAMTPTEDLKSDDITKARMGLKAASMNNGIKKVVSPISFSNTCLVYINQLRANMSVYGAADITGGGRAKDYYATSRIDLGGGLKLENKSDGVYGNEVSVKVFKNKQGAPKKEATFKMWYGKGFIFEYEILDTAIEYNIVKKSGSWYSYDDVKLGQGEESVIKLLMDNPEVTEEIKSKIKEYERN